jgi:hypothetical protein
MESAADILRGGGFVPSLRVAATLRESSVNGDACAGTLSWFAAGGIAA